jgi:cytochrome P450
VALGVKPHDSVLRLVELSRSKALNFDVKRVIQNVGGLLIGAVETTSHEVVSALEYLMAQPEVLARAPALGNDPTAADGFAFEDLRFKPAFPYFFRMCEQDTVLGRGEPRGAGIATPETVLAVTPPAMFDPRAISQPETFDPTCGWRPRI